MRKRHTVRLSEEERARLHTLIGQGTGPARALTHARILLKANQGEAGPGWTDAAIGAALEVNPATVARVRMKYVAAGLDAAVYRKAPERQYPRRLDGEQEAYLAALACSAPPEGRKRWTLRLLADRLVELELELVRQPQHPHARVVVRGVPARRGQAAGRPAGAALHAQAWQLAEHGRDRACRAGRAVPGPPPGRPGDPGAGGRSVAGGAQRRRSWVHWCFTTADARIKLKHLYPTIQS